MIQWFYESQYQPLYASRTLDDQALSRVIEQNTYEGLLIQHNYMAPIIHPV